MKVLTANGDDPMFRAGLRSCKMVTGHCPIFSLA